MCQMIQGVFFCLISAYFGGAETGFLLAMKWFLDFNCSLSDIYVFGCFLFVRNHLLTESDAEDSVILYFLACWSTYSSCSLGVHITFLITIILNIRDHC